MQKASNILLKIGYILNIVCAVLFFLYFFVEIIICSQPTIREGLIISAEEAGISDPEAYASLYLIILYCLFSVFLFVGGFSIVAAVCCKKAREYPCKRNYILAIVFSFLSDTVVGAIGGILGLVVLNKQNKEQNPEEE